MQQLMIAATLIPPCLALATLAFLWAWATVQRNSDDVATPTSQ